jgi:hypothetical protein
MIDDVHDVPPDVGVSILAQPLAKFACGEGSEFLDSATDAPHVSCEPEDAPMLIRAMLAVAAILVAAVPAPAADVSIAPPMAAVDNV